MSYTVCSTTLGMFKDHGYVNAVRASGAEGFGDAYGIGVGKYIYITAYGEVLVLIVRVLAGLTYRILGGRIQHRLEHNYQLY